MGLSDCGISELKASLDMLHKNNFKNTHSLKTNGKEIKSDAYKTVNGRNHICKTKCSTFDFFKKTSTIKETVQRNQK